MSNQVDKTACCCGTVRPPNATSVEIGGVYHRSDGPCYHVEPQELTATLGSFGPRFVEFVNGGRRVAVNPEHVAVVSEFQGDEDVARRFCTLIGLDGRYLTDADGTLDEVVAKLTAEKENH